jgi:uncharacterized membrane protein YoaK (UPF0700 family)
MAWHDVQAVAAAARVKRDEASMTSLPGVHSRHTHGWPWRAILAPPTRIVVPLAFAAGCVDALSYLGLGHIFTANQTGNIVLLGLALGEGHSLDAQRSLASLFGFILGVVLAHVIGVPTTRQAHWPASVTRALALECAILLVFTLWGASAPPNSQSAAVLPFIVLMGCAMGMQNVSLQAIGIPGMTSTAITSTLTMLTGAVSMQLLRRPAGEREREGAGNTNTAATAAATRTRAGALALLVGMYLLAAVATSLAEPAWLLASATIPTVTVALAVVAAPRRLARQQPPRPAHDRPTHE